MRSVIAAITASERCSEGRFSHSELLFENF